MLSLLVIVALYGSVCGRHSWGSHQDVVPLNLGGNKRWLGDWREVQKSTASRVRSEALCSTKPTGCPCATTTCQQQKQDSLPNFAFKNCTSPITVQIFFCPIGSNMTVNMAAVGKTPDNNTCTTTPRPRVCISKMTLPCLPSISTEECTRSTTCKASCNTSWSSEPLISPSGDGNGRKKADRGEENLCKEEEPVVSSRGSIIPSPSAAPEDLIDRIKATEEPEAKKGEEPTSRGSEYSKYVFSEEIGGGGKKKISTGKMEKLSDHLEETSDDGIGGSFRERKEIDVILGSTGQNTSSEKTVIPLRNVKPPLETATPKGSDRKIKQDFRKKRGVLRTKTHSP